MKWTSSGKYWKSHQHVDSMEGIDIRTTYASHRRSGAAQYFWSNRRSRPDVEHGEGGNPYSEGSMVVGGRLGVVGGRITRTRAVGQDSKRRNSQGEGHVPRNQNAADKEMISREIGKLSTGKAGTNFRPSLQ